LVFTQNLANLVKYKPHTSAEIKEMFTTCPIYK